MSSPPQPHRTARVETGSGDPLAELVSVVARATFDCGDLTLQQEITTALAELARRAESVRRSSGEAAA